VIASNKAADPATHLKAARIASRVVLLIQSLLRGPEERDHALRSVYEIAREEIEGKAGE
jgi:hypothetical protein